MAKNIQFYSCQKRKYVVEYHLSQAMSLDECRRVGMADEADSKSVDGNIVRVQVPLPA